MVYIARERRVIERQSDRRYDYHTVYLRALKS